MKNNIESFLEEQESIGNFLINIRQWAMDRADEKFKKEYEDIFKWEELYDKQEGHPDSPYPVCWILKEGYNDIYWQMVDTFEEELEEYKSDIYES